MQGATDGTRRRRTRPRTWVVAAGLTALVLLGFAVRTATHRGPAPQADGRVVLRLNQAGYEAGAPKTAYAMGSVDDLDGATYAVVRTDDRTVTEGELGTSRGVWNDRFTAVRPIDLTTVSAPGRYTLRVEGPSPTEATFTVVADGEGDRELVDLSVRFFQAQRDGSDVIPTVLGRKPSHLLDREATVYATPRYDGDGQLEDERLRAVAGPVDVEGGWFDAGDFLKFTGTTAWSTIALQVAARDLGADGLDAEVDHGLRWLARMWDQDAGVLFTQVGIGNGNDRVRTDHDVWRLPETDDATATGPGTPDHLIAHRPVFRANEPGDRIPPSLAGRVAASFALAAQASETPAAAREWLTRAAAVYALADTSGSANPTAVPAEFYPEDSWQDDLELAAVELALAARQWDVPRAAQWQREAAGWATAYLGSDTRGSLEVADVSALAHAELIALGDASAPDLVVDLRRQLDDGVAVGADDPFGVGAPITEFDSVPHALGLAATARLFEKVTGDRGYRAFAAAQTDWVLGANPWGTTFVVGVGEVYPRCPEHQVDNLAGEGDVVGAVVNGPNRAELLEELNSFDTMQPCSSDPGRPWSDFDGHGARYLDTVGAWQTVEPAIDFTANGILAFAVGRTG